MHVKLSDEELEGINLLGADWFRKARAYLQVRYDAQEPQTESIEIIKK